MCDGWIWAFCPRSPDHFVLCHKLLRCAFTKNLNYLFALFQHCSFCTNNKLFNFCLVVWRWAFSQGKSFCWNLAGTANNAGAILVLGRDLVVVPKLIHPLPPALTSPESSPERHLEDTWMQVLWSWTFHAVISRMNLKGPVLCLYGICEDLTNHQQVLT